MYRVDHWPTHKSSHSNSREDDLYAKAPHARRFERKREGRCSRLGFGRTDDNGIGDGHLDDRGATFNGDSP